MIPLEAVAAGMTPPASETTVFTDALDWEAARALDLERSARRAWRVAGAAVGLTVLSWLALVLLLPLKQTVPFVIRVDSASGVPDVVTTLADWRVAYNDVLDKYWLAQYVRARETYDWYTLQKDYNTVGLLSAPVVGADYAKLFEGPEALDKKWSNAVRATVDIVSVVPTVKGTATVRFRKTTKRVADPGPGDVASWVATVAYEYRNPSKIKESLRLVNPFGFQVLSYRVDPELVSDHK